jgi:formamidopyrimidine-DNA glycosylase
VHGLLIPPYRGMPELPEVETTVRGLAPVLEGRRLVSRRGAAAGPAPALSRPIFGQRLTGATVTSLGRRAKYGLIDTDRGDTLIFHLGMSGRWRIDPARSAARSFLIETDEGRRLALNDPRRFGSLDLVRTDELAPTSRSRRWGRSRSRGFSADAISRRA